MSGITLDIYLCVLLFILIMVFFMGSAILLSKIANSSLENINKKAADIFCIINVIMVAVALVTVLLAIVYAFNKPSQQYMEAQKIRLSNGTPTISENSYYGFLIGGLTITSLFLALFIANSVFLGKIRKVIITENINGGLGKNLVTGFWIINIILSILVALLLMYFIFEVVKRNKKTEEQEEKSLYPSHDKMENNQPKPKTSNISQSSETSNTGTTYTRKQKKIEFS